MPSPKIASVLDLSRTPILNGEPTELIGADTIAKRISELRSPPQTILMAGARIAPSGMLAITEHAPNVLDLQLPNSTLGPEGLSYLSQLAQLRVLNLQGTSVSDEGVNEIVKLQELRYLNIWQTGVTDEGILLLSALPNLGRLLVGCSDVQEFTLQRLMQESSSTSLKINRME